MQRNNVKLISMDTISIEAVKWLLYPFIPLGKITILQGDPGEGKTTLALQIIAALTTGKPVWEGAPPMEPVIVQCQHPVEIVNYHHPCTICARCHKARLDGIG